MMFERMMEPFGVEMNFKFITNPLTDPTQTSKVPEPSNPEAAFIATTSNRDDRKERAPLDMATKPFIPVKFGIGTFNDQVHTLSSHRVELQINELAELSETVDNEKFAEANTSHILRHWTDSTTVRL